MSRITVDRVELLAALKAKRPGRLFARPCSLCGYEVATLLAWEDGELAGIWFDPGCYCTGQQAPRESSIDEIAHHVELQTNPDVINRLLVEVGMKEEGS